MTPPPPPHPSPLTRVSTVCFVLRFVPISSVDDIIKLATVSDTFRDALENHSATVWRRLASSVESSALSSFFKRDAFAWIAENMLTVGQLDVSDKNTHPLHIAAESGAADVARVCLAAMPASCIDVCDRYGRTALHFASADGRIECVRELLAGKADIMPTDDYGHTALHCAARHGHVGVVRLLVAHPDFDKIRDRCNRFDGAALHVASAHGHAECVRVLLAAGADIAVTSNYGRTALHYAAEYGHVDVMRLLVAHTGFERIRDKRDNNGKTARNLTGTHEISRLLSSQKSTACVAQ